MAFRTKLVHLFCSDYSVQDGQEAFPKRGRYLVVADLPVKDVEGPDLERYVVEQIQPAVHCVRSYVIQFNLGDDP